MLGSFGQASKALGYARRDPMGLENSRLLWKGRDAVRDIQVALEASQTVRHACVDAEEELMTLETPRLTLVHISPHMYLCN